MKERTLLIVDDSPRARDMVKMEAMKAGLFSNIFEAGNGIDALKIFFSNKVNFIVTDVTMPHLDGYKFIAAVKTSEEGKDTPVIMISADRKEVVDKIKGLEYGANDYIIKPFDGNELVARMRVFLKLKDLHEELREKNSLLERLAATDELTGLHNRRWFYEHLEYHTALAKRHSYPIACILIDIDRFKNVNDIFGHDAGDRVLKKVASALQKATRHGEVLARFGGDEFIICLFMADENGALAWAERARNMVEQTDFSEDIKKFCLKVTISAGIAVFPQEGLKPDDIIKAADKALYRAKEAGRNLASV